MSWLGFVIGVGVGLFTWATVLKTLVFTRADAPLLERLVILGLRRIYLAAARLFRGGEGRDNLISTLAPVALLLQLAVWLALFFLAHALMFWPFIDGGLAESLRASGSSLFTLGISGPDGAVPTALIFVTSATGLVVIALYIAYLPTLYGQFNLREAVVSQLESRAGAPPWGPNVLARHQEHGITDALPTLYETWNTLVPEVSVAISHYPLLAWFRGPDSRTSWITSLLAVLDSAALYAALAPGTAPVECKALLMTSAHALEKVSSTISFATNSTRGDGQHSTPTFDEFRQESERLRSSGFPVTAKVEDAWAAFGGERSRYADRAYVLADAVLAPAAPWLRPDADDRLRKIPATTAH